MRYGSVCSGIEAATAAWHPLGWKPAFFSEIENFPRAVLRHHYPETPLHGDFTTIGASDYEPIDILVGGTPCQSFSVAGLRKGLADDRGNLALEYLRLAERLRPQWLVWENVPGVLSSSGGRDFGSFLGGLVDLGYGFAYRVLDAQYFGVAQRRRRVFVVGCLGDWRRAAAVLFERESLSGNPAPGRETRQAIAGRSISRALTSSHTATGRLDPNETTFIPVAVGWQQTYMQAGMQVRRLSTVVTNIAVGGGKPGQGYPAVAFGVGSLPDLAHCLRSGASKADKPESTTYINTAASVRRLTPVECERLQGFQDDFTLIPYRGKPADKCPDGPRYKALGNSMAVPVMAWIGQRIQAVDDLGLELAEDRLVEIVVGIN